MSKHYTEEQKSIARRYEGEIMDSIEHPTKFDELMAEFEELKEGWDKEIIKTAEVMK